MMSVPPVEPPVRMTRPTAIPYSAPPIIEERRMSLVIAWMGIIFKLKDKTATEKMVNRINLFPR